MSTVDTSAWSPDIDLNESIEGIPLNADSAISQTWLSIRALMAALKGDGDAIRAFLVPFSGATASADGASGLVPAPQAGDQDKFLKGDGTWGVGTDSNAVHKTGNETIAGTKTFSSQIVGTIGKPVGNGSFADMVQTYQSDNNGNRSCTIRCTNGDGYNQILIGVHDESNNAPNGLYIKNTTGTITGEFNGSLQLTRSQDASGTQDNSPALSIGSTLGTHLELDGNEIMAKSSGTTTGSLYINAQGGDVYIGGGTADYKSVTGRGKGSSTVPVYTNADGIVTACGSPLDVDVSGNASTATKFATPAIINGVSFDGSANITVADSTKVAKAGDTMTGNLTISKASPHLETKNTSITRGTSPSSDTNVTEILGKDSADKLTWALYHRYATNKAHRISLLCYNGLTTDNQYAEIGIGYDSDGNPYTYAPTPAEGDSTTKIATTYFVNRKCNNYLLLTGGTMTGALNERASNVNLSIEPETAKEDQRFFITKSTADTVHTGNLVRLGVTQSAGTKDYRVTLAVANPRAGNLPTQESIAGGYDDSDARTSNNWGGIGVYYDYSKNRAYPYCYDLDTCDPTDNSTQRLATNRWVRTATGDFACNAATATKLASPITINGVSFDGSANITVEDSAKLPAAGGVMTGEIVSSNGIVARRNDAVHILALYGGTEATNGGRLGLYGGARSASPGSFELTASIDSSTFTQLLGKPDGTLAWGGQSIQTSSDERLKTPLSSVPDAVLDAWEDVQWGQFQYLDAVERKGGSARLHLGLVAQRVKSVFEERSLDACDYGILCYEQEEDMWTVRYAEALAMEAVCQRRRADRLEARIKALEEAMR